MRLDPHLHFIISLLPRFISQSSKIGQSWSNFQQKKHVNTLRELALRRTPGYDTPLPDLTRQTLSTALHHVAKHIHKKNANITIIAVGGAVNTMYLRSRNTTHDVDFFNNNLTAKDFEYLIKGAKEAVKKNSGLTED